jgi:hypothetical protein
MYPLDRRLGAPQNLSGFYGENQKTFRRNISPLSSGSDSEESRQQAEFTSFGLLLALKTEKIIFHGNFIGFSPNYPRGYKSSYRPPQESAIQLCLHTTEA